MSIFSPLSPRSSKAPKGFTLIELLVVITIMVLVTAAVMLRQSSFDSSTLLRSLSYSVALTMRSAQVYGTSVRGNATAQTNCTVGTYTSGNCYAGAYGVYFNNATSYTLFADNNGNGTYDSGIDGIVQTYQIGAGFKITKFCGVFTGGTKHCSTDATPITWLVVYFKRPAPDALFKSSAGETYNGAYIQIAAINDPTNTHSISVSSTGEISVGIAGS